VLLTTSGPEGDSSRGTRARFTSERSLVSTPRCAHSARWSRATTVRQPKGRNDSERVGVSDYPGIVLNAESKCGDAEPRSVPSRWAAQGGPGAGVDGICCVGVVRFRCSRAHSGHQ